MPSALGSGCSNLDLALCLTVPLFRRNRLVLASSSSFRPLHWTRCVDTHTTHTPCSQPDPGVSIMHPEYLATVPTVTWYDDTSLWLTSAYVHLDNLWYFSSRMSPLFKARRLNESHGLPFSLPPLRPHDIVYMPDAMKYTSAASGEWARAFLTTATGVRQPRVEHDGSAWAAPLNSANIACFRRAVLTGAFGFVVSSWVG